MAKQTTPNTLIGPHTDIPNWEDPSRYPDPNEARLHDWAWEFIRRNPEYRREWEEYQKLIDEYPEYFTDIARYKNEHQLLGDPRKGKGKGSHSVYSVPNPPLDPAQRELFDTLNGKVLTILRQWPFQLFLPNPSLNWRDINAFKGIWWKTSFVPQIKLPGIEMRPRYYGIAKPDRFAVIFSLDYLWGAQAKFLKKEAKQLSRAIQAQQEKQKQSEHKSPAIILENGFIDYESRQTQLGDSSVLRLGTVEAPFIGYSFTREKAFARELGKQLKIAESDFAKAEKLHRQKSARNRPEKYRLYLRLLDAKANGIRPCQYMLDLYPGQYPGSKRDFDPFVIACHDLNEAERLRDSRAIQLITSPSPHQ